MALNLRLTSASKVVRGLVQNHQLPRSIGGRRNYLTAAYSCEKQWTETKSAEPLYRNLDSEQLFVDISRKFATKNTKNVAIDVDVFVNTIKGAHYYDEMENTLNKLRRSKETINTLGSTHFGVLNFLLANELHQELITVLSKKASYGLFPDVYSYNMLLDYFLVKKMSREAAKVAVDIMLQENPGNEITRMLSLIACERYLSTEDHPLPWTVKPESTADAAEDDDDEITYVRVPNLTNPWFDDHFDLTESDDLVGKSLVFFGSHAEQSGPIRDSAILIGLARCGKWDQLKLHIQQIKQVSSDAVQLCFGKQSEEAEGTTSVEEKNQDENNEERPLAPIRTPQPEWVREELGKLKTCSSSLLSLLEAKLSEVQSSAESSDVAKQIEEFKSWSTQRNDAIRTHAERIDREKRIELIREKKKELAEKQEFYYVFENWNKIEMLLDEVEREEKTTNIQQETKDYIPPSVNSAHN